MFLCQFFDLRFNAALLNFDIAASASIASAADLPQAVAEVPHGGKLSVNVYDTLASVISGARLIDIEIPSTQVQQCIKAFLRA
jgi:hypothetical protein